MQKNEHIVRASAEEIEAMRARGESQSDWAASQRMTQAEVNRLAEEENGALPDGWESTIELGVPGVKQAVHIRLDAGVLDWFRASGPGYQTRINAVLRSFVQARVKAEAVKAAR